LLLLVSLNRSRTF